MTIAIAWVRKFKDCEELVFVSDSRLGGDGNTFDACPKILTFPRSDCAISFAGYTGHAFPMMLQLSLAISGHAPLHRGSVDISALKKHAVKVFDSMASELKPSKDTVGTPLANPDASFIFGGYSWVDKRFKLWTIAYRPGEKRFSADPPQWCTFSIDADRFLLRKKKRETHDKSLGKIAFAGDQAKLARRLLLEKLNNRERSRRTSNLDMEPFEVVRDMLRDEAHADTIGGAPQVVKVYQYMHSTPLAVYWPTKSNGTVNLQGRECLGYERIDPWVLDPDSLTSEPQPVPVDRVAIKKKRRSQHS